eukprot:TRINITY_DN707_c0_g1_i3.p1 TRINITY_DN707_c0_g1~~TRINITY_DN707_c0_g1_i3.p1  ORF type:complete len:170 (+),score=24.56 TRINITY_DN707_c0_g1_i3:698-1207(+)
MTSLIAVSVASATTGAFASAASGSAALTKGRNLHTFTVKSPPRGLARMGVWPNQPMSRQIVVQCSKSESPVITTSTTTETSTTQTGTAPVTIEFQRQKAKELIAYFEEKKYEEKVRQGRIFGWTRPNEINNGRWTMFGIAVGLLTEYATGVSLVDQIKIIISNLGIADI